MSPGVNLVEAKGFLIPDYLTVESVMYITLSDHLDPSSLPRSTAIVYEQNLYLTDVFGNIAYIDCQLVHISPTRPIRNSHSESRSVSKNGHDAGHFGLSLGQHPSIAMEQDRFMNRWGIWRIFERYWSACLICKQSVRIIGVFADGDDTYSPFWCIHEDVDGEITEYVFTNDNAQ
jgi:hypothetical protein